MTINKKANMAAISQKYINNPNPVIQKHKQYGHAINLEKNGCLIFVLTDSNIFIFDMIKAIVAITNDIKIQSKIII